jgi:hypothetical protein
MRVFCGFLDEANSNPTGAAVQVRALRIAAGASESIGLHRAQSRTSKCRGGRAWSVQCDAVRFGAVRCSAGQ